MNQKGCVLDPDTVSSGAQEVLDAEARFTESHWMSQPVVGSDQNFRSQEDPGLNLTLKSTSRKSFAERHAEVAARPKAVVPPLEPLS